MAQVSKLFYTFAGRNQSKIRMKMKKLVLTAIMVSVSMVLFAQQKTSKDYIIKTKNVTAPIEEWAEGMNEESSTANAPARDFISTHFPYYSLCDWKAGMRFMVLPEKYDLIVRTFTDATNDREVSSVPLRYKILVYDGFVEKDKSTNGRARMNFHLESTGAKYYYEIPSGSFADYCYGKKGVPTLAYLGDVDIALETLVGKKVFTKTKHYRIDTDNQDGSEDYEVGDREEVEIVAVGVGTRSFPVKIIVENEDGKQFYQNVAISKTNCGMRDDEFIMDNARHLFSNSFELEDDIMMLSDNYRDYIGKIVHTRSTTKMLNEAQTRNVNIISQTGFQIMEIRPLPQKGMIALTLKNTTTSGLYYKNVRFASYLKPGEEAVEGEELFGKLFALGEGKQIETSTATRAAIRAGRVTVGMSEDEVLMVMGDPEAETTNKAGNKVWRCRTPGSGKVLAVEFGKDGRVKSAEVDRAASDNKKGTTRKTTTRRKTTAKNNSWQKKNGTPVK